MIKIQLYGEDEVHNRFVFLPACPRTGDSFGLDGVTFTVVKLFFIANEDYVTMTIERAV